MTRLKQELVNERASASSEFIIIQCRPEPRRSLSVLSFAVVRDCVWCEDKGACVTESIITVGILVGNIINKANCIVGLQFPMPNAIFQ